MKKSILLVALLSVSGIEAITFLNISRHECNVENTATGRSYTIEPKSRQEIPGTEFSVVDLASAQSSDPLAGITGVVTVITNAEEPTAGKKYPNVVYARPAQTVLVVDIGNISGGKTYLKKTTTVTPVTREEAKQKYPAMFVHAEEKTVSEEKAVSAEKNMRESKKDVATFLNISKDKSIRVQPLQEETKATWGHRALTLISPLGREKGTGIAQIQAPEEGGSVTITAATKDGDMIGRIETFILEDVRPGVAYIVDVKDDVITATPMMEVHAKRQYGKYYKNLSQE